MSWGSYDQKRKHSILNSFLCKEWIYLALLCTFQYNFYLEINYINCLPALPFRSIRMTTFCSFRQYKIADYVFEKGNIFSGIFVEYYSYLNVRNYVLPIFLLGINELNTPDFVINIEGVHTNIIFFYINENVISTEELTAKFYEVNSIQKFLLILYFIINYFTR